MRFVVNETLLSHLFISLTKIDRYKEPFEDVMYRCNLTLIKIIIIF